MWELDHQEGWMPKNWCFWIVVLEKTLESPLDCKEIKPVNPKGNELWIFIRKTDAEVPIRWQYWRNWLIGKDLGARKKWRPKEKGAAEDTYTHMYTTLNDPWPAIYLLTSSYRLNSPKFLYWSPNLQYFRIWLCLERVSLKRQLS